MKQYGMDDAEAELREAIDADDLPAIRRLEPVIDALDVKPAPVPLGAAALWYASVGLPVFPLTPGGKAPLPKCAECRAAECRNPDTCGHQLCHGFKDATTDQDLIRRWWHSNEKRNIGIATGHGFDAVDIDGPLGQFSRVKHWGDLFEAIDNDAIAKVLTPRPGGMHIYVPPTGDGNSTGIVPGVDYRGLGGYVVAPPSAIAPGGKDHPGTYSFLGTPHLDSTPEAS